MEVKKDKLAAAIKAAKATEKKRKFNQTIDLIINLKEIDVAKDEAKIEEYIKLPHGRGKPARVCAFVGAELKDQADKICDVVVLSDDFPKWTSPRNCKKLARQCNFFIAQANIMPDVAKTFGRFLGPVGKMPNPKAGQIVPPKINLTPLVEGLKKTIKVAIKKSPVILCAVGSENMEDAALTENALAVLERIKAVLPKGIHNINAVLIKTTMGAPVKVSEDEKEK